MIYYGLCEVLMIRCRHHSVVQCLLFLVDKFVSMLQSSSNAVNGGDAATHEINPMLKTLQLDEPSDSPDDRMRYNTIGIHTVYRLHYKKEVCLDNLPISGLVRDVLPVGTIPKFLRLFSRFQIRLFFELHEILYS